MHAPSEFSKNLLTCSAASSCSTAFFRAFYLRGCESLPLGTEGQTSTLLDKDTGYITYGSNVSGDYRKIFLFILHNIIIIHGDYD